MNMSGMPASSGALTDWRIYRVAPGEVVSPTELADRMPCWEGWTATPDVTLLLKERDPDASDWWLVTEILAGNPGYLHFPEVNGVAELWIDQQRTTRFDNAFIDWRIPVSGKTGAREVALHFLAIDRLLLEKKPRARWAPGLVKHQQLRWLRQPLTGRLRGWSEHSPPVGLGRAARFSPGFPEARVLVHARVIAGVPLLQVRCHTDAPAGHLRVRVGDAEFTAPFRREGATWLGAIECRLPGLDLWMPHTHGHPALHALEVCVDTGLLLETATGFRSTTLDPRTGELRVNGRRIFARGACLLPGRDVDPGSLVDLAVKAGFNLLRLPGTGGYASEALLSQCDRAGVLLWQDLPFASMDYPDTPEFIEAVSRELEDRLTGLDAHPCVAVVCGGSDNEQQAVYQGLATGRREPGALRKIIGERVAVLLPQIPFVSNTPSGGALPTHTDTGFSSYFGIGAYRRPLDDRSIDRVRFATECLGFSNVAEPGSLARFCGEAEPAMTSPAWKQGVPRDAGTGWDFDDVRDHYTEALFGVNCRDLRFHDKARYLELSRIASGAAMSMTLSRWRAAESRCNGALLWTLNDLSPGCGWGLIDSLGRPKAAWYQVRRVCQPVQLVLTDDGLDGHHLHLLNESALTIEGRLEVMLIRPDGRRGATRSIPVALAPGSVREVSVDGLFGQFQDTTWAHRFGRRDVSALAARMTAGDHSCVEALGAGQSLVNIEGSDGLRAVLGGGHGHRSLVIESDRLLQWVRVDVPGWIPEDNYFHVLPGISRTIELLPAGSGESGGKPYVKPANAPVPLQVETISHAS